MLFQPILFIVSSTIVQGFVTNGNIYGLESIKPQLRFGSVKLSPQLSQDPFPFELSSSTNSATTLSDVSPVATAKRFVSSGFGLKEPSILSSSFRCSSPVPGSRSPDKQQYLSGLAKETAAFQRAIPDFDLRPYGFTVDSSNPKTVWFKVRPIGTVTGPFSYGGEVYPPNGKTLELPVQQFSVTLSDDFNSVESATFGYVIDKLSGTTGGLAGPNGVLFSLGEKPLKVSYTPPAVVVKQFFGRRLKPTTRKLANEPPFPESVMFALAQKILDSFLGAKQPDLLADDFQYSTPFDGPLSKKEFIQTYTESLNLYSALSGFSFNGANFQVDDVDPERVWIVTRPSGELKAAIEVAGKEVLPGKYGAGPEVVSVSFDKSGLCYRVTSGYVVDRNQGNTQGLGGLSGLKAALGVAQPFWETRSISDTIALAQEALLSSVSPTASKPTQPISSSPKVASTPDPVEPASAKVIEAPKQIKPTKPVPVAAPKAPAVTKSASSPAAASTKPSPASAPVALKPSPSVPSLKAPVNININASTTSNSTSSSVKANPFSSFSFFPQSKPSSATQQSTEIKAIEATPKASTAKPALATPSSTAATQAKKVEPAAQSKEVPSVATAKASNSNPFSFLQQQPKAPQPKAQEQAEQAVQSKEVPAAATAKASNSNPFSFLQQQPKAPQPKAQTSPQKLPQITPNTSAKKELASPNAELKPKPNTTIAAQASSTSPFAGLGFLSQSKKTVVPNASKAVAEPIKAVPQATASTSAKTVPKVEPSKVEPSKQLTQKPVSTGSTFGFFSQPKKAASEEEVSAPKSPPSKPVPPLAPPKLAPANPPKAQSQVKPQPSPSPSPSSASGGPLAVLTPTVTAIIARSTTVAGDKSKAVQAVDSAASKYLNEALSTDAFVKEIIQATGSRQAAVDILPDIIGCLPRGEKKSNLNNFFQQQFI